MVTYQTLEFFSRFEPDDVQWFFAVGVEQQVISNAVLVRAGTRPEALFFVLEGLLDVVVGALDQRVASLGPGALFGEMSFLEEGPASADVVARENSLLLRVPQEAIRTRTTANPRFAATFFQAVSLLMAERLRASTGALLQHLDREQAAALSPSTATHHHVLQERVARAKELFHDTDRLALKNHGVIPDERVALVREQFSALVVELNHHLGNASPLDPVTREALGRWVQGEMLPYLHVSRLGERMYAKPRGYAGDFLTIEYLYEDRGEGTGRLGPLIDRCFLDQPAARAIRNRRSLRTPSH